MKNDSEKSFWLGFSVFSGIGPVKFSSLLNKFGSAKNAWTAKEKDLKSILGKKLTPKFLNFRESYSIQDYEKGLKTKKVHYLILTDKQYPKLLKATKKPPFVLYIKGKFEFNLPQNSRPIAVVGARKTTHYGREVTKLLTEELVLLGFTVVSGMAFGIDTVAAQTAIDSNGKTIAVLGNGVDVCHPITNKKLYNEIVSDNGAIVSEIPIGQKPSKGLFPARNRIIAGLSLGVLVTEGAEDSGALITAANAALLGRPVFAVPGPITSTMSKGPYKLIEKGAKLVTSAQDILKELKVSQVSRVPQGLKVSKEGKVSKASKDEEKITNLLQNESLHFNEIVRKIGKSSSETGTILSLMEIKGIIKNSGAGFYSLI
ncbi:MAG: DNA protecting protein DprA [Candidatus Levybacteria bacterium RBG_16_35_6]|nr:MAG: DNA protecting protein DprA [Candidatus Levybacteria bacterium RBG_16_35_6]